METLVGLNNTIVGLGIVDRNKIQGDNSIQESEDSLRFLYNADHCPCIGIGLIRSIDVKAQQFLLLTCLSTSVLQHVNVIMTGNNLNNPVEFMSQVSNNETTMTFIQNNLFIIIGFVANSTVLYLMESHERRNWMWCHEKQKRNKTNAIGLIKCYNYFNS